MYLFYMKIILVIIDFIELDKWTKNNKNNPGKYI
jgi:hypothetical protein